MTDADVVVRVLDTLRARGLTLATAESLSGGLVCAEFVNVPGASDVVRGGVIAYATELKAGLLGVDPNLLAAKGAVDPDVAAAMAAGVARLTGADFGLATTGVAGPDPQDGQPVGTVFVAVGGNLSAVEGHQFTGTRNEIRRASVEAVISLLDGLLRA